MSVKVEHRPSTKSISVAALLDSLSMVGQPRRDGEELTTPPEIITTMKDGTKGTDHCKLFIAAPQGVNIVSCFYRGENYTQPKPHSQVFFTCNGTESWEILQKTKFVLMAMKLSIPLRSTDSTYASTRPGLHDWALIKERGGGGGGGSHYASSSCVGRWGRGGS